MAGDGVAAAMSSRSGPVATPRETKLFIAGEWRDGAGRETAPATSPASGAELGPVAQAGREEAGRAVQAAADAYPGWARETAFARAKKLHAIGEICERRRDELAHALTLDQGKPL